MAYRCTTLDTIYSASSSCYSNSRNCKKRSTIYNTKMLALPRILLSLWRFAFVFENDMIMRACLTCPPLHLQGLTKWSTATSKPNSKLSANRKFSILIWSTTTLESWGSTWLQCLCRCNVRYYRMTSAHTPAWRYTNVGSPHLEMPKLRQRWHAAKSSPSSGAGVSTRNSTSCGKFLWKSLRCWSSTTSSNLLRPWSWTPALTGEAGPSLEGELWIFWT